MVKRVRKNRLPVIPGDGVYSMVTTVNNNAFYTCNLLDLKCSHHTHRGLWMILSIISQCIGISKYHAFMY